MRGCRPHSQIPLRTNPSLVCFIFYTHKLLLKNAQKHIDEHNDLKSIFLYLHDEVLSHNSEEITL